MICFDFQFNIMEKNIIKSRLLELSRDDLNLSRLVDLTVYEVSRVISWEQKQNYGLSFHVLEHFGDKPEKAIHTIYRYNEADIYELLSIMIIILTQNLKKDHSFPFISWHAKNFFGGDRSTAGRDSGHGRWSTCQG